MTVKSIIEEYAIELDDIRWYLSVREADRLLTYRDDVRTLATLIQSGRLEADWYRMAERFLDELQEKLEKRTVDEAEIRKICAEIEGAAAKRWTA